MCEHNALPPMLTIRQYAEFFGRHHRTVELQIQRGELKAIDISAPGSGRPTWRIPREEVLAIVAPEVESDLLNSFTDHIIENISSLSATSRQRLSEAIVTEGVPA